MTIDDIFHQVLEARTAAGAASGAMEAASGSAKGKGAERKGELSLLYEMLVCVLWGASASLRAHPLPPAPPPHAAAATVPEAAAAAAAEAAAARAPSPAFLPSRLSGRHARTDALLTSLFAGARLRTTDIAIAANLVAADPAYVLPEDVARRLLGAIDAFARGQKREAAGAARLEVGAQLKAAELGEHTQLEEAERRAGMSRSPNRKARLAAVVTADASPVAHPTYAELRRVDAAASILSTLLLRHLVSERAHRALLWPVSAIELTLTALVRLDAGARHAEGGVDEPSTEASEPRPVPKPAPTLAAADGAAPSTSAVPADAAAMPMVVGAVEARAEAVMVRGMGADAAEDGDGYNEEEDTYFDSDRAQSELRTRILDEAIELGLADPDRVDPFADEYTSEAQMTMNLLKGAHGSASASSETFGSAAIKDAGDHAIAATMTRENDPAHREVLRFKISAGAERGDDLGHEAFETIGVLKIAAEGIGRVVRAFRDDEDRVLAAGDELFDEVKRAERGGDSVGPAVEMNDKVQRRTGAESVRDK